MGANAYGQADADIVHIPDVNFKKALVENTAINTNGDTEISYGEARAYTGSLTISRKSIKSLIGIEAFVNITVLDCSYNRLISLDLGGNILLKELICENNILSHIDVSKNTNLEVLKCNFNNNRLTSLDVSKNTKLRILSCLDSPLTTLDVSNNTELTALSFGNAEFTSLDISKNTKLIDLHINHNTRLASLDLSNNTELTNLSSGNNPLLTSLDLSKNTKLYYLSFWNTQFTSIDLSKNTKLRNLYLNNNNKLTQLNMANGNNGILSDYISINRNFNLTCIQIDAGFTPPSDWQKDDHASYSDNCNYPPLSITEVEVEQPIQILNPVKDKIIIKNIAKVERIEMYNMAGRLVKILFRGNTIVQDLAKGVYIVKITTDKGVITERIIKE